MQYKRSIGAMKKDDWECVFSILDAHLELIQQDAEKTNDEINDIKLLIHKLGQHVKYPAMSSYSFNRWS